MPLALLNIIMNEDLMGKYFSAELDRWFKTGEGNTFEYLKDLFDELSDKGDYENDLRLVKSISSKKTVYTDSKKDKELKNKAYNDLVELYLNFLLLAYNDKLGFIERHSFLDSIRDLSQKSSSYYTLEEKENLLNVVKLEEILFLYNKEEVIEYIEVFTGNALKLAKNNKIDYNNPDKNVLDDKLIELLLLF